MREEEKLSNFPSSQKIALRIEEIVRDEECNYIEACIEYAEEIGCNIEDLSKHLHPNTIASIETQAHKLKMLKDTSERSDLVGYLSEC